MDKKIFLNNKKQALPYSLNALKVKNFQGIKSLEIADLPCDAQWIFLTGENGFGKTSVLRSIAEGFSYGQEPHLSKITVRCQLRDGKIHSTTDFTSAEWYNDYHSQIVGYGISRFSLSINIEPNLDATASLFKDNAILESIEQEIKDWYEDKKEPERFETIKTLLCTIVPALQNISVEKNFLTDKKEVFYTEKGDDGRFFQKVGLKDLATGYRNIICMIGDMLIRLRRMQHESIDKKKFKDYEGIVIIDEFDAHLHPKYQYELPKLLSDVFPKVQFIVSTHSPIPLLGAPKDSAVVLKVNRTASEGITIERMDETIDIERLSPNALLSSDIFGYTFLFARDATPESVSPFDDYKEIEEMDNVEKLLRIKNGLQKHNIRL
jgi:predicted ATP-binding protein involved in virulence